MRQNDALTTQFCHKFARRVDTHPNLRQNDALTTNLCRKFGAVARPVNIDERLAALGLVLHGPHPPHDPLDAVVVHDGVARTSGQLPRIDGQLTCVGVVGETVTVDEAREAASVCALNALSVLRAELGSLDLVDRILSVTGYVASAPGFVEQPAVIDGASKVLVDVFGERGRHTRSAIGVAALPRGGAVEIELTAAIKTEG